MDTSLRQEIAKQLKFNHTHQDLNLSYMCESEQILKLFEKRIDELIQEPNGMNNGWNNALDSIKEIIKK